MTPQQAYDHADSDDLKFLKVIGEGVPDPKTKMPVHLMDALGGFSNSLTKCVDGLFGPDEVDSLDASCNTCVHLVRKPMMPPEKAERNIFGMPGHCSKKDVPVRCWHRGQYCGFDNRECYENRRTGMRAWASPNLQQGDPVPYTKTIDLSVKAGI